LPGKRSAFTIAALAAVAVLAWQLAVVYVTYGGNVTGLFFTGARFPPPPDLSASTWIIPDTEGYDGQFYRYVAHDPFFTKGYARYVDDPRLRYRRILVPALARAGPVFGRSIEWAYVAVVLVSTFAGVYWSSRWMLEHGLPAICGAAFVLVPGTLASIDRMLVDGTLVALAAGFFWYSTRQQWRAAALCAGLAMLTRETGLLLVAGGFVAAIWQQSLRRAALFAGAAVPAAAWYLVVQLHTSPSAGLGNFSAPLIGIVARVFVLRSYPDPALQLVIRVLDVLSVLGLLATFTMTVVVLRGERNLAIRTAVVLFVMMGLFLSAPVYMQDPYAFSRPISPLILWLWMRAAAERRWLLAIPPIPMSLAVGAYLASRLRV
jgi:hypothetical protein